MSDRTASILIKSIIHILTLEEIEELTHSSMGAERLSLTEMMEGKFQGVDLDPFSEANKNKGKKDNEDDEEADDGKAKILPFNKKASEELAESLTAKNEADLSQGIIVGEFCEYPRDELEALDDSTEAKTEVAVDPNNPFAVEEVVVDDGVKESTSDFILNEKKRLSESQRKLKKGTVLQTYAQVASVDIQQQKSKKGDLTSNSDAGILVDKKQY